ncbi:MAG TPA: hypothetical protein VMU06_13015 [Stellaceae bacterium]|nr:hypothetical protein [Stellaceae bacterium]
MVTLKQSACSMILRITTKWCVGPVGQRRGINWRSSGCWKCGGCRSLANRLACFDHGCDCSPATVTLHAPGPFQHFGMRQGRKYASNEASLIENVLPEDVAPLIESGCWLPKEIT